MKQSLLLAFGALILSISRLAHAEIQEGSTPKVGVPNTVSIGDVMFEQYRFRGIPGIVLSGDVEAHWGSVENVVLPAGTPLAVIRARKLKACQTRTTLGWVNCVIDVDDDGKIDLVSFNDIGGAKKVEPVVAYTKQPIQMGVDPRFGEGDNFKRELIFTGAMPDTLTVSYREFINNLARPAFTEPLSIPLTKTFPQNISIKGHIIELIKIDGMGLHYTLKN